MNHLGSVLTKRAETLTQRAHQQGWARGIRVKVQNGNLELALQSLQTKMRSSGMEGLIKRHTLTHIKNSEKRVLARKSLQHRVMSRDLAAKLKSILIKKVRGL